MDEGRSGKSKSFHKMPVLIIVVWIIIAVLFGYSLWNDKHSKEKETSWLGSETSLSPENANQEKATPDLTDEEKRLARSRDQKRLADMKMMRSILESYKKDNGHYPDSLEELKPRYLKGLPKNPSPGGRDYVYTGIGARPYQYFDFSYGLEVGAEGISPGMHIMSPAGIATP